MNRGSFAALKARKGHVKKCMNASSFVGRPSFRVNILASLKKRSKSVIPASKRGGRLLRFLKKWTRRVRKLRYVVIVGIAFYRRDPYALAHVLIDDKYLRKYCRQPTGPVIDTLAHPLMYVAYIFNPLSVAIFPMASPFAAFSGIIQWLFIAAAGEKGFRVDFVRPANLPYIF